MAQDRLAEIENTVLFQALMSQGCPSALAAEIAGEECGVPSAVKPAIGPGAIDTDELTQSITHG